MTKRKPPELHQKDGRPTDYKPHYVEEVYKLALLNLTDKRIASYFNVDEATLNRWKLKYPEFCESLRDGKEKADATVAKSLYERAVGYEWTEEQAFKIKTGDNTEKVEIVQVRKAVPPETAAITRWLTNRQRDTWTERTEVQNVHTFAQMPTIKVGDKPIDFNVGEAPPKGDSNG